MNESHVDIASISVLCVCGSTIYGSMDLFEGM